MSTRDVTSYFCTVCGVHVEGWYRISIRGTVVCDGHTRTRSCGLCGAETAQSSPGWERLSATVDRCPWCAVGAVVDDAAAVQQLPSVRVGLQQLGFTLKGRVRLRVVEEKELAVRCRSTPGKLLGVTQVQSGGPWGGRRAVDVKILRGLPPIWFGSTVAHENMHAWLAENEIVTQRPEVEEGLCEVLAYGWLSLQNDPLAPVLRARIRESTDPVYGGGFRLVQSRVRSVGLPAVLAEVAHTGDLR